MLVGLFKGLEGLEAAVGEEHGANVFDGQRSERGGSAGTSDVDVGLLVMFLLGEERRGEKAQNEANSGVFHRVHVFAFCPAVVRKQDVSGRGEKEDRRRKKAKIERPTPNVAVK
jgi:hypothetical protein